MRRFEMKRLTALFLTVILLCSLVSCGEFDADTARKNLKKCGYAVTTATDDDLGKLASCLPDDTVYGFKGTESISIFFYGSAAKAEKAKETYLAALGEFADVLLKVVKIEVKGATFYMTTDEASVRAAYNGVGK